ncbi:thyrotropin-releasing hormone receptor-like isoform X2 [Condylostylus longicornis]|uniref:thyrotropin-releasing hormone receptor-like isoform X2 n=1 Tax=Condylostylus longicornis TaxID=2530218 RepID=UPI00244E25F7|nr:thyrotropin-releasing hormone receptor-like isoform X2 [Condylostylus longicornis]
MDANVTGITHETVTEIRDIVQKIIIPIVFIVGLIGNSITVVVLTRKSMRCSTNVYLTALAVTDMLYLTTTFLLTLQHYQSFHLYHPIYWRCFGLIIWFHDGLSYISIYIATCFTIERFIAVRYPIRRQQFCTEELAKKVIVGISILCIVLTVSTAFEYSVDVKENYFNTETNEPCPASAAIQNNLHENLTNMNITRQSDIFDDVDNDIINYGIGVGNVGFTTSVNSIDVIDDIDDDTVGRALQTMSNGGVIKTSMSKNKTTEFVKNMTCPSSKSLTAAKTSKVSQENKITIVLIAVVILFIICQLPWSIYLIVQNYIDIDRNLKLFLGNIFNLLVDINSAMNFFLYCVLSDKYRKTVKELINNMRNHHHRHQSGNNGSNNDFNKLSSSYNIYNTICFNNDKNSRTNNWNIDDNSTNKTNQLLMMQQHHKHKPIQQQHNTKQLQENQQYQQFNKQKSQQQQYLMDQQYHNNRNCPYYSNLNKIWTMTKPTTSITNTTPKTTILMPDEYYIMDKNPANKLNQQQQQQQQYKQQRRRSLSLTSLPKIKHAPSCKDFPDDL